MGAWLPGNQPLRENDCKLTSNRIRLNSTCVLSLSLSLPHQPVGPETRPHPSTRFNSCSYCIFKSRQIYTTLPLQIHTRTTVLQTKTKNISGSGKNMSVKMPPYFLRATHWCALIVFHPDIYTDETTTTGSGGNLRRLMLLSIHLHFRGIKINHQF